MRVRSAFAVLGLSGSLVLMAGVVPAAAKPALRWQSPSAVTNGAPVSVASIQRCPHVPTRGDTLRVQINLSFTGGGGSGQLVPANDINSDGSWSGAVTFNFQNAGTSATLSAECMDFTGNSATPYAQYQASTVSLG